MTIEEIKIKISELAIEHKNSSDLISDSWFAEEIELEAESLILKYCIDKGYTVEEIPKNDESDEDVDEFIVREEFILKLDILCLKHDDVLDLNYFYVTSFYIHFFENIIEFRKMLEDMVRTHEPIRKYLAQLNINIWNKLLK